jgi:hypothetical protein
MFTFETTDPKEVRRLRTAQFNGRPATFRLNGSAVTGHIHSIVEKKSADSAAWAITVVPVKKAPIAMFRPAPRIGAFAEDLY